MVRELILVQVFRGFAQYLHKLQTAEAELKAGCSRCLPIHYSCIAHRTPHNSTPHTAHHTPLDIPTQYVRH
jgi:hypothetical protein